MFAYAGGCNAYKYQTCHACPRSGRIEWIHNGYDRRVTVFPITLSPCIRIRKLPAVRYYHTRGQIEILVCRAPLGSMSTPRRAFSIFVRFIVLDGAHTHTHTYREIRARRSPINSLRALQSEFSTLLPEWNRPGMYPLAVKISAHLLWTVRKIPFPAGRANGGRGSNVLSNVSWKISRGLGSLSNIMRLSSFFFRRDDSIIFL